MKVILGAVTWVAACVLFGVFLRIVFALVAIGWDWGGRVLP